MRQGRRLVRQQLKQILKAWLTFSLTPLDNRLEKILLVLTYG